jgi:hypothetical protein
MPTGCQQAQCEPRGRRERVSTENPGRNSVVTHTLRLEGAREGAEGHVRLARVGVGLGLDWGGA